jgi:biopolymer transport protein ExbB/biopolymer transport protein TolQ
MDLWAHMGTFARLIVALMLLMSTLSAGIMVERVVALARTKRESRRFAERAGPLLSGRDFYTRATEIDGSGSPLGRVVSAGLSAYKRSGDDDADSGIEAVARALEGQAEREVYAMKRGQNALSTIASTAPFIGLLGTVVGIVNSFQMMARAGSGGLGVVSAGIAEALVTTALGLLVAIPAVVASNAIQGFVEAQAIDISHSSNELLEILARALRAGRSRGPGHPTPRVVGIA